MICLLRNNAQRTKVQAICRLSRKRRSVRFTDKDKGQEQMKRFLPTWQNIVWVINEQYTGD